MGDRGFEEEFCLPSELLTDELILMGKENLYKDKRNLTFPRTSLLTESPNESLSYYSNNFLVPPFSSGPKIPEKTWEMTSPTQSILSPVLGNGRSLVPSPPITPIGRSIDYYQVNNMNSQGQRSNFTPINPSYTLPSTHTGTMWGHQQLRGHFGTGGYDITPEMAWGGPQRRSCGGVEMRALGYSGGIKRECAGTGVFLPRRYHNTTPESRKKSGGSTTKLPPRVVQAQNKKLGNVTQVQASLVQDQNKKFENVTPQLQVPRQFASSGHISEYELVMARKNAALVEERRKYEMMMSTSNAITTTTPGAAEWMKVNNEIRLPQEWTYY